MNGISPLLRSLDKLKTDNPEISLNANEFNRIQIQTDMYCFDIGLYPNGLFALFDSYNPSNFIIDHLSNNKYPSESPRVIDPKKSFCPNFINLTNETGNASKIYLVDKLLELVKHDNDNPKLFAFKLSNGIVFHPSLLDVVVVKLNELLLCYKRVREFKYSSSKLAVKFDEQAVDTTPLVVEFTNLNCKGRITVFLDSSIKVEFSAEENLSKFGVADGLIGILADSLSSKVKKIK